MTTSVLYLEMDKPAALTAGQWTTALTALRALLGKADTDGQPFKRLHWRFSLDGTGIIIAATFDLLDLDMTDLTRIPAYISTALSGAFTPTQVRTALVGHTTVFGGIAADWETSRQAAVGFLITNSAAWEPVGP